MKSNSILATNTLIYSLGNILPQSINFLLLPLYTHFLTPHDYGIVASMAVVSYILNITFTLCMEQSAYRLYFDHGDLQKQKEFFGTIFCGILINASVFLALFFLCKAPISTIFKSISFYPYYVYPALTSFFTTFGIIPRVRFQVQEKALASTILSFCQFFVTTGFVVLFICYFKRGAAGQLEGQLISWLIMLPVYLYLLSKSIRFVINLSVLKNVLAYCIPTIPSLLTAWVLNMSSRIFLERNTSLSDVGIYSMGYTIASAGLILLTGFTSAYVPYFYRLANGDINNKSKLEKVNNAYFFLAMGTMFLVALFSKEVITLFMQEKYAETYNVIRILTLAYFFSGLTGLTSLSILQNKKSKENMFISVSAALFNTILNFFLIPRFGMYGAAYSLLITFLGGYIVQYQYSKRCYFIPLHVLKLTIWLICGIIIVLSFQLFLERWFVMAFVFKCMLLIFGTMFIIKKIGISKWHDISFDKLLLKV